MSNLSDFKLEVWKPWTIIDLVDILNKFQVELVEIRFNIDTL